MKKLLPLLILSVALFSCTQKSPEGKLFELGYMHDTTVTWEEAIDYYSLLDEHFPEAKLIEYGKTDIGKPLHLFVISKDKDFDPVSIRKKDKRILFILNGIHPGESCGMDAALEFAQDMLVDMQNHRHLLENTVVAIIPAYNIGGVLNRSAFIRTNQVGPVERGHRGNGRNLDLNRDFAKQDSKNARSFAKIFQEWDPDVFLDTHTTNGSDHQYVITLIPVQPSTFPKSMQNTLEQALLPDLYSGMAQTPYELIPYVMYNNRDASRGIVSYRQTPKVSTGYAEMFNSFGFMTENHVYKPYADRVQSVYLFMHELLKATSSHAESIAQARNKANETVKNQKEFVLDYTLDTSQYKEITFKGYEQGTIESELTGLTYKYYDHNKPFTRQIKFFNRYTPKLTVEAPAAYIIPQAWEEVIERLQINGVDMYQLEKDRELTAKVYYIKDLKSYPRSYNGHFYHHELKVNKEEAQRQYYAGDWIVPVNQTANKFIVNMLEPQAPDSYLRWNFFDSALESREWNNPGVTFEANAIRYLETHPELKARWEAKRKNDAEFRNDHRAQLRFIFENSEWSSYRAGMYPVGRLSDLP